VLGNIYGNGLLFSYYDAVTKYLFLSSLPCYSYTLSTGTTTLKERDIDGNKIKDDGKSQEDEGEEDGDSENEEDEEEDGAEDSEEDANEGNDGSDNGTDEDEYDTDDE